MNIPKYQTIAGQSYPSGSFGKNDLRFRIQNTMIEECREYGSSWKKMVLFCTQKKKYPQVVGMRIT